MKHLTSDQRYEISAFLKAGLNKSQIADQLHVHKSTISREIRRNGYSRYRVYKPKIAQARAEYRWLHRKLPRRFKEEVKETARKLLEKGFSPEQIVGYCRKHDIKMVSHETLYQWIWWDKKHKGTLYKNLRQRGRRHTKRGNSRKRRGVIPKGTNFDEITVEFLGQVEESLNNRPRRRYGFSTPLERFSELTGLSAEKFF